MVSVFLWAYFTSKYYSLQSSFLQPTVIIQFSPRSCRKWEEKQACNSLGSHPENVFSPWTTWRMVPQALYTQIGKTMRISAYSLSTGKPCVLKKGCTTEYTETHSDNISISIHICIFTHEQEATWSRTVCLLNTTTEGPGPWKPGKQLC